MGRSDELRERLREVCSRRSGRPVEIGSLMRVAGGSSRETWAFDVGGERFVLRLDPPGAPVKTERGVEVEVLRRATTAGVPVPEVRWTAGADELGSDGFAMPFIEGETIGRRVVREESLADVRPRLAAQCGRILARIHTIPCDGLLPAPEGNPARLVLEQYRGLLDSMGEPHPAFELGLRWLSNGVPEHGRTTVVHGDFRNGNLIIGPDGVRAVLDWELVHAGDPWEDLAWLCVRSWRFGAPGPVGGFGEREDLFRAYEEESGFAVDREAVRWWEAMGTLKWGIMTIGQAFTHLWGHVRSLDLAAIGRRTVECEYDLLNLIRSA